MVEQEVCGELLVLVAGEVGLDSLVTVEAEAAELFVPCQILASPEKKNAVIVGLRTYTFNSIALFFGDGDRLRTRGKRSVVITILTKETQELIGVLGDQLGKLGVASPELLQNRLQHLRLLLDDLAQLLELGVVAKEVEVAKALSTNGGGQAARSRSGSSTGESSSTGVTATLLGSEVKEVDVRVIANSGRRSRGGGGGGGGGGLGRGGPGGLLLCLRRTQVFGDTLLLVSYPSAGDLVFASSCSH